MERKIGGKRFIPTWWDTIKVLKQPLILLGADGIILRINETALDKLNYREKDLKYLSILDLIHKEDKVKEVNNYIDISYGNQLVSTSNIRLKESGGSYVGVEQILHMVNANNKRRMVILSFQVRCEIEMNEKWEDAGDVITTIKGLTNMFNLEEYGSSYNKSVVDQIKLKLEEFKAMVSKKNVA
jgi:hypothetical protein